MIGPLYSLLAFFPFNLGYSGPLKTRYCSCFFTLSPLDLQIKFNKLSIDMLRGNPENKKVDSFHHT